MCSEKTKKIAELIFNPKNALIICILVYLIVLAKTFLASYYPGGVDTSTHLFQISLIADEGLTAWNHWWYAGNPQLDQYPPLPHAIGALLSYAIGVENAYKIVAAFAFLLLPICFLLLVKEFLLDEKQQALALYIFCFSSTYAYHLQGGVLSALFAFALSLLFLKYFIRSLNDNSVRPILLASLFLALTALSHLFIPVAACLFAFIYLVSFTPNIQSFKRSLAILFVSGCLVAFFWVPLILNYQIRGDAPDVSSFSITSTLMAALGLFGRAFVTYINYLSLAIAMMIAVLTAFAIYASIKKRDLTFLLFFILSSLAVVVWVLFLPHAGQAGGKLALFIPVFFSIFLARYSFDTKAVAALSIILVALMLASVLMIRNSYVPPETYNIAEWAAAKTESRFLMIPQGFGFWIDYENKPNSDVYLYDVYLMPHYFKKENYYGWFGEAAPRPDIYDKITFRCTQSRSIGELAGSLSLNGNIIFTKMKTCTIEAKPEEFCSVLKEGAVDHVFVNRNFPEVIAYADSAGCLVKDGELKQLVSYAVAGHKKYADGTEGYVKKDGVISLKVEGQMNGTLIVRESYYPYWKAYVDGKEAKPEKSEYGFISVPIDAREGSHAVVLEYKPEKYNGLFSFVSAIAWIAALTVLIKPDVLDKMARKKK